MAKEEGLDLEFGFDLNVGSSNSKETIPLDTGDKTETVEGEGTKEVDSVNVNELILKEAQEKVLDELKNIEGKEKPSALDDKTNSTNDIPFSLLHASLLREQGVISDYDEDELKKILEEKGEDGEVEVMSKIIENTINQAREEIKNQYEEDFKEYTTLLDSGVSDGVAKKLILDRNSINKIDPEALETSENEELRKQVLTAHYKNTTTFNDAKIEKLVKNLVESGEDIDEAKEALNSLKERNATLIKQEIANAKKAKEDEEKRQAETISSYKTAIQNKESIVEGTKLTKKEKSDIESMIFTPIKTEDGRVTSALWLEREKDPVNFDIWLAYAIKNNMHKGGIPERAKTKIVTDTSQKLKDAIKNRSNKGGFNPNTDLEDDFKADKESVNKALF